MFYNNLAYTPAPEKEMVKLTKIVNSKLLLLLISDGQIFKSCKLKPV